MREKLLKELDDRMYFCIQFKITIKFKNNWVKPHLTDYKSMNDDDLIEFYNRCIAACAQPRG
jgi:hypothetical protein